MADAPSLRTSMRLTRADGKRFTSAKADRRPPPRRRRPSDAGRRGAPGWAGRGWTPMRTAEGRAAADVGVGGAEVAAAGRNRGVGFGQHGEHVFRTGAVADCLRQRYRPALPPTSSEVGMLEPVTTTRSPAPFPGPAKWSGWSPVARRHCPARAGNCLTDGQGPSGSGKFLPKQGSNHCVSVSMVVKAA